MPNNIDFNGFPHFILVPLMAQGHMIPMLDLARLLAASGATVTFITTPVNAARIRPAIDRIQRSALPIRFVELRFPSAEAGLPEGCENFDLVTSSDFKPFINALHLLRPQFDLLLAARTGPPPDCIIFDSLNSWAATTAKSLGIPHLIFYGPSCFYMLCSFLLKKNRVAETIADASDHFPVPGLREPINVIKSLVDNWLDKPEWEKISGDYYAAEESAHGVVMNTFDELELSSLEKYRNETGKKVWTIGPLSLSNKDVDSQAMRGQVSSIDTLFLVNWLDSKAPSSVMFINFGSLVRNPLSQLVEIGEGVESALSSLPKMSFLWVVKEEEKRGDGEKWLSEFEERVGRRGMVIRGWAPQALILTHVAVGGFMTHCGWNSILEAVVAGVVMATWPRFGDQFLNEKMVVDVLKVGVAVGAKKKTYFMDEKNEEAEVKGDGVRKAVEMVMDGGKEGEERRRRVREFGEKGRKAMEDGGSSLQNLKGMIQFAMQGNCHME